MAPRLSDSAGEGAPRTMHVWPYFHSVIRCIIKTGLVDDVNEADCIPARASRLGKQTSASQLKGKKSASQGRYPVFSGRGPAWFPSTPVLLAMVYAEPQHPVFYLTCLWEWLINGFKMCIKGRELYYSSCGVGVIHSDPNDPIHLIAHNIGTYSAT